MSDRRVIIVGYQGQDGRLLTDLLRRQNVSLLGIGRTSCLLPDSFPNPGSIHLCNPKPIQQILHQFQPHEIYYLAAHHRSSQSAMAHQIGEEFHKSMQVNVTGLLNFLEGMKTACPTSRLFYASSSLIFGQRTTDEKQDETTVPTPGCHYSLCKLLASRACQLYREQASLFASVGILYNHESILRSDHFVSKKIILTALRIRQGSSEKLRLGNLDAVVDWGYAPDYVRAFTQILSLDEPEDFIISTGMPHTVRDFAGIAFEYLGLNWRNHVITDNNLLTRKNRGCIGNPEKLKKMADWSPSLTFEQMVKTLIDQSAGIADGQDVIP